MSTDEIIYSIVMKIMLVGIPFYITYFGLKKYLSYSQSQNIDRAVREETGERHLAKSKIPDMGGIVLICVFALFIVILPEFPRICDFIFYHSFYLWQLYWPPLAIWIIPVLFGCLGLADDIVKNRTRNTKGIPARFRIIIQIVLALIFVYYAIQISKGNEYCQPPLLQPAFWGIIFILASVNAANFTDGLDGLLTGMSIISILGIIFFYAFWMIQGSLDFPSTEITGMLILMIVILSAFLIFNRYPAKMFMGDGGSMLIGGFLGCFAYQHGLMPMLLIIAFPMYFELISVVIQVISFKLTGKRIFPMTPFHHSFEKWGWSEPKIVWFFYIISFIFMLIGVTVFINLGPEWASHTFWKYF